MNIELHPPPRDPRIRFLDDDSNRKEPEYHWYDLMLDFLKSQWVKRVLWIIVPLIILNFWLYRYDDFTNGCHIKIGLSLIEWNNLELKSALKSLREKSPGDYQKVCTYVTKISPDLPCGGSGGGCFRHDNPKQIEVSTMNHRGNSAITAAMIVHETCHSIQHEEKRALDEKECYHEMNRMFQELGLDSPWKTYE